MTSTGIAIASCANGVIFSNVQVDARGQLVNVTQVASGATVYVYIHEPGYVPITGGTQAQVYADEALTTPLGQPLTTDQNGNVPGYLEPGSIVDLVATGAQLEQPLVLTVNTTVSGAISGDVTGSAANTVVETVLDGQTPATAPELTAETTRAETAEGANTSAITAEVTRAEGVEATKAASSALITETTRAEGAESANSTAIGTEVTRAEGVEATKAATTALTAETSRAEGAEGTNATAIAAETTRAEGVEVTHLVKSGSLTNGHLVAANSSGQAVDSGLATSLVVSVTSDGTEGNVPTDNGDGTYSWDTPSGGGGSTLGGVFLPESYGAVGDGDADDSVALNECMNAVRAYGKGATMWLSKLYKCSAPLNATEAEGFKIVSSGGRKNIDDLGPGLLFTGGTGTGAISSLTAAIASTTATTISATPVATELGDGGFVAHIDSEYIWVYSGASTDTWTVRRGLRDSTPATHADSAEILPAYGAIIAGTPQGFSLENTVVIYNNASFDGDLVDFDWYPYSSDCTNFDVIGNAFTGAEGINGAASLLRLNHAIIGTVERNHFGSSTGPGIKVGDGDYVVGVQIEKNTFNCGSEGTFAIITDEGTEAITIAGNTFEPIAGTYAGSWQHLAGVGWHISYRDNWHGDQSDDSNAWVDIQGQLNSATIESNRFNSVDTADAMINFAATASGQGISIRGNEFNNGAINITTGANIGISVTDNSDLNEVRGDGILVQFGASDSAINFQPNGAHPSVGVGLQGEAAYTLDVYGASGPLGGDGVKGIRTIDGALYFGGTNGNADATASIGTANLIGLRFQPGSSNAIAIPSWDGYNFSGGLVNGDSALFFSQDGSAMHPRFMAANSAGAITGPHFMGTYLEGTGTWDPGAVGSGAIATTTVTVTGAKAGQPVSVGLDSLTVGGVLLNAIVTADDTVTVTLLNSSGASQTIPSGNLQALVWQH